MHEVGGRPFWPADTPWPTLPSGSPSYFLAQFNFADSEDIVGQSVAEAVLVVVANSLDDWLCDQDSLSFYWIDREITQVAKLEVPSAIGAAGPFFGAVRRTEDYPDAYDAAYKTKVDQSYNLDTINGTKIGGTPHFIQSDSADERIFLCQLGSIQAAPDVIYPWVNQRAQLILGFDGDGIYHESNCAVFNDMGTIYFFADEEGNVTWDTQCY